MNTTREGTSTPVAGSLSGLVFEPVTLRRSINFCRLSVARCTDRWQHQNLQESR
jgi:hypothetical protein